MNFSFLIFIKYLKINSILKFNGFPQKSKIPMWLKEIISSSSDDHLRKLLVFVTGSPSISSSSRGKMEINVRCQARSGLLPVAHTCFFSLGYDSYPLFDCEKFVICISFLIIILINDFYLFERFLPNFWFPYFSFN